MIDPNLLSTIVEKGTELFNVTANKTFVTLIDKVEELIDEISTGLPKKKLTLSDMAEIYSSPLDVIMKRARLEGYRCAGGEFKIKYVKEDKFVISYDLYMQDSTKKWIKRSSRSPEQDGICFTDDAWNQLKTRGTVTFEIDPPQP